MNIHTNVKLDQYTSIKIGGPASQLVTITSEDELAEAIAYGKGQNLPVLLLGGGTNIIVGDEGFKGLVILNRIMGLNIDEDAATLEASAGELWDDLVKESLNHGLRGIESLSLIPGSAGAAPVNNIGAYGQEVKDTISRVRAYDTETLSFVELPNDDCRFEYRNSIFKSSMYGRYIITKIYLQLHPIKNGHYRPPAYGSLTSELQRLDIKHPTPQQVREIVISIRTSKLPDPTYIPNAGSFFKNPIIPKDLCDALLLTYPEMPYFESRKGAKLSAAWLIDKAGLRGKEIDGIRVYDKQPLVLINEGSANYNSLKKMKDFIQNTIVEQFGISLEPEPEIIADND